MNNKEAVEFFAKLFPGINVTPTGNIGGRDVEQGYACSYYEPGSNANVVAHCYGGGIFEATMVIDNHGQRIRLMCDPNVRAFEVACIAFKAAYDIAARSK